MGRDSGFNLCKPESVYDKNKIIGFDWELVVSTKNPPLIGSWPFWGHFADFPSVQNNWISEDTHNQFPVKSDYFVYHIQT